jgi:single-strand DNA-binding protein
MQSLNRLEVIGRLGKDPEPRFTPTGKKVCSGSVAMTRKWKNGQGEDQSHTEWVNWEAWGTAADIISQYYKKGNLVFFEGRLQTDKVEGDGGTRYFTKLVINDFMMLNSGNSGGNGAEVGVMQTTSDQGPVTPVEEEFVF